MYACIHKFTYIHKYGLYIPFLFWLPPFLFPHIHIWAQHPIAQKPIFNNECQYYVDHQPFISLEENSKAQPEPFTCHGVYLGSDVFLMGQGKEWLTKLETSAWGGVGEGIPVSVSWMSVRNLRLIRSFVKQWASFDRRVALDCPADFNSGQISTGHRGCLHVVLGKEPGILHVWDFVW